MVTSIASAPVIRNQRHVFNGSAGAVTAWAGADDFVIESADATGVGMTILSPDAISSGYYLGSASDSIAAGMNFNYTSKLFTIGPRTANGIFQFISGDSTVVGRFTAAGALVLGNGDGAVTALTGNTFRAPDAAAGGAGNVLGADLTIAAGLGTGTGDVGTIIFSLPIVAAAGDNIQTRATRLTLDMAASATALTMLAAQDMTISTTAGDLTLNPAGDIVASSKSITQIGNSLSQLLADAWTMTGANAQRLYLTTTNVAVGSNLNLQIPASGTGAAELYFQQGAGNGDANNMRYIVGYNGNSALFLLYSEDIDGSSTAGVIWQVADGFNDVRFLGGISLDGAAAPTSGLSLTGPIITPSGPLTLNPAADVLVADGHGLVIGHTAQVAYAVGAAELQVLGTSYADSAIGIGCWNASGQVGSLSFIKSNNAAIGSSTIVSTGTRLGVVQFYGDDGVNFLTLGCSIVATATGTMDANRIPTDLIISLDPGGSDDAITEVFRIKATGRLTSLGATLTNITGVGAGVFGGGIAFTDVANAWIDDATHGDGTTTIYIGNQTITTASDMRLKTDLADFQDAGLMLSNLHVIEHGWSEKFSGHEGYNARGRFVSLLAQEAIGVVPYAVNANGGASCSKCLSGLPCSEHGDWHMQYDYLVPLVIKGWQEHESRLSLVERQVQDIADRTWPADMAEVAFKRMVKASIAADPEFKGWLKKELEV